MEAATHPQLRFEPFEGAAIDTIEVGVSGNVRLSVSSDAEAELFEALTLGQPVRLVVTGWVSNVNHRRAKRGEGETTARRYVSLQSIDGVEKLRELPEIE
jgi:hypothetical protein